MKHPQIAARIFNTPLLIHPQKLDAIIAGLGDRLLGAGVELPVELAQVASLPAEMFSTRCGQRGDNGYIVTDGVAVIHASGALVHRSRYLMADSSYLLGYNELAVQLEAAMEDPEVHAILQVFDSPGGEVAGAFEYGDRIHAQRGRKPMWAIADTLAASAAYLGGSAFDSLAVSATGYAGSIGVVMRHVDFSRALANDGIRVTHIFAGDHKVDGNPYEPLPKDVQANLQEEVDGIYTMFVDAVVRNRGLKAQAVRNTQASVYRGEAAVSLGLADRVSTTDQLLSELAAKRVRSFPAGPTARSSANQGAPMSGTPTEGGQPSATPPAPTAAITQADITAARAEGAAAERQRIADVRAQTLPGHEALVEQLAFDGKTTGPEAASAVLKAERERIESAGKALRSEAPAPLALVPGSSVQKPASAAMTSKELDAQAKKYQADHPGTDYLAAVKAVQAAQA
ncbi:S49 family peptidase [Hydrogenophaga sp. ANAO-22]|uniref:S49 family peptidase n=1 Tax=Hydrogenophaga sp. ANAO-22 TaxID=3166645 RepID=UPI0036D34213